MRVILSMKSVTYGGFVKYDGFLKQLVKEIVLTDGVARISQGHHPLGGAINDGGKKEKIR